MSNPLTDSWPKIFMVLVILMMTGSRLSAAETPLEIDWEDLIPKDAGNTQLAAPTGKIEHGQLSTPIPAKSAFKVTEKYNGETVRIPGYIVPLEYDGSKIKQFLLVPYVGACIHVPPPPANQLIYVTT